MNPTTYSAVPTKVSPKILDNYLTVCTGCQRGTWKMTSSSAKANISQKSINNSVSLSTLDNLLVIYLII